MEKRGVKESAKGRIGVKCRHTIVTAVLLNIHLEGLGVLTRWVSHAGSADGFRFSFWKVRLDDEI